MNRMLLPYVVVVALAVVSVAPGAQAQGRELYRYRDGRGNLVIDHHIPPEYVAGGYEVLNRRGVVLRVVPRTLTEEERAKLSDQQVLEEAARDEEERLRRRDEMLLMRYIALQDLEAARDRALRELEVRLGILRSNRRSLRQQIENYQAQAADLERQGREIDPAQLQVIEQQQRNLVAIDRQITEREQEIEEARLEFEQDIERFIQLDAALNRRRQLVDQVQE